MSKIDAMHNYCGYDCGAPEGDRPVVVRIITNRKEEAPIPGQVTISDLLGLYHDLYGADAEQMPDEAFYL